MANEKIEDVIKKVILGEGFLVENPDPTEEPTEATEAEEEGYEQEVVEEEVEDLDEAKDEDEEEDSEDEEDEDEEEDEKPSKKSMKEEAEGIDEESVAGERNADQWAASQDKKRLAALRAKKRKMQEEAEIDAMSMTDLKGKKYIEKDDAFSSPSLYKTANGKTANIGNAIDLNNKGKAISDDKYNRGTITPKKSNANGKVEKISAKESIETLFAGKELSEDFKTEAATLFEAHLAARTNEIEEEIQAKYETLLEEHTLAVTEEMVERIDEYLNYVVEEWMQENRLAVSNGLRTEIAEGFIEKLRGVFAESYIEIPEEKLDLFESTVEDYENLKGELDEQVAKNMEINEECEQLRCELLFREMAEGLTDTETQKLRELAESVEFDSVEQFAEKLAVLRENIEKLGTVTESETATEEESLEESYEEGSEASPLMEAYLKSMSKSKD